nr:reverse transcriptase domain-containing protein [Tanacetum cinerariifolium]
MQTRSSSRLFSNPSSNPTLSTNPNPKGRNRRRSKQKIEEFNLDELSPPIVTMADQCTMAQLLQAPTEGYEDAIVVPTITADNFKLKHGLLTLVQNKQFFGHDKEDPHAHIRYFNKITSTLKFPNVPNTEAWDRFKDLLRACPHHDFSELHQLDTFYNVFNSKDQDSLNSVTGGNFLDKMPRECLAIIESKFKFRYSRNKPVVAKVSTNTSTSGISPDAVELKDMVKALFIDKKSQNQASATVKTAEESCVTCGGAHSYRNCPATDFVNSNNASTLSSGTLPSNTIANPRSDLKAITTQSGVSYDGPQIPPPPSFLPKVVENKPEATKDTIDPTNNGSTKDVQPLVVQTETPVIQISKSVSEPVISSVSAPKPNLKSTIPYPSRRNDERNHEKASNQIEKFYQILRDMSFEISFADALILMPKFSLTLKALIENKEKLSEMARTPLNEHFLAVLLKKFPEKLGDTGKFLIPCDFPKMDECLALADLGASINLMPLSMWKRLSLPELTPTYGKFHFPADFVVVEFDADPRVPLILGRSFLKTGRALIDLFEGELTFRVGKEAITFNLDQTSRYSANYNNNSKNRIDVIEMACEEYSQEVLDFFDVIASGNPTPYYEPIVSTTSLTLTPFGNCDFLLEEVDAFLALEDDPTSPEELKICEAKSDKSSINEPPEVELKDLPPHLEYSFLEGDNKLPVIIAKDLSVEEKTALITVLKSHKRAIAWKLFDIKGIDPEVCTHKILMEDDFEPAVQHQRRVNPKIHDVIKNEVLKLLDAGLIYPISDSPNLTEAPILIAPDWDMPFELMCDASDFAIGAVLGQRQDKHFRPIHYASKTMTETESNYTTTEKEMLAVEYAFEKFRLISS